MPRARVGGRAVRAPPVGEAAAAASRSRWSARWSRCASSSRSATRSSTRSTASCATRRRARLGIVAAGVTAHDVAARARRPRARRAGAVRVLAVGMLFPLDEDAVRGFALGLDEILVIEEKGPFLERLVRDALYGGPATPLVLGAARRRAARRSCPAHGALDPDAIARVDRRARARARGRCRACASGSSGSTRSPRRPRGRARRRAHARSSARAARTTRSMVAPDEALVGAGIGCHTMVMLAGAEPRHRRPGSRRWAARARSGSGSRRSSTSPHFMQNLGDGTFHHSGSLAIRAAVAAGVNITYKLLVQRLRRDDRRPARRRAAWSVPALARSLEAEGVRRIVITTDEAGRYAGVDAARDRRGARPPRAPAVQRELARGPGRHRAAARPGAAPPSCGASASAAARRSRPERVADQRARLRGLRRLRREVELPLGRAGRDRVRPQDAHQPDQLQQGLLVPRGRLPVVRHGASRRSAARRAPRCGCPAIDLPEPEPCVGDGRARAHGRDRRHRRRHRQPGPRDGGAARRPPAPAGSTRPGSRRRPGRSSPTCTSPARRSATPASWPSSASADVLLGFDLIGAADPRSLRVADPDRTVAIVSEHLTPTAQMVVDVDARGARPGRCPRRDRSRDARRRERVPRRAAHLRARCSATRRRRTCSCSAPRGSAGRCRSRAARCEQAIELNGVGVERNLAAFEWGRAWVAAARPRPRRARRAPAAAPEPGGLARQLIDRGRARAGRAAAPARDPRPRPDRLGRGAGGARVRRRGSRASTRSRASASPDRARSPRPWPAGCTS